MRFPGVSVVMGLKEDRRPEKAAILLLLKIAISTK
jgi:hypothetical protein